MKLGFCLLLIFLWSGCVMGMGNEGAFIGNAQNSLTVKITAEKTCNNEMVLIYVQVSGDLILEPLVMKISTTRAGTKGEFSYTKIQDGLYLIKIMAISLPKEGGVQVEVTNGGQSTPSNMINIVEIPNYQKLNQIEVSRFNSYKSKTTGEIRGTFKDGSAPFTIKLLNNQGTEINTIDKVETREFSFDSLRPGEYRIKVTDACSESIERTSLTIAADCELPFKPLPTGTFTCKDQGTISWSFSDNVNRTAYYRLLPDGVKTLIDSNPKNGLAIGTYQVIIEGPDCKYDTSIILRAPNIPRIEAKLTHIICSNVDTGAITLTVTGGTDNYTYKWGDQSTTTNSNSRTGLKGNTSYMVTVTDNVTKCEATGTFTIEKTPKPELTPTSLELNCADTKGQITLTLKAADPKATYEFIWDKKVVPSPTIENLPAGTYTASVKDKRVENCVSEEIQVKITAPPALGVEIVKKADPTCPSNNIGAIEANPSGGTKPYSFMWSLSSNDKDSIISSLGPGTYTVTVTDSKGCKKISNSLTLSRPESPKITDEKIGHIVCSREAIGSINISVSGRNGKLSYKWSNGATTKDLEKIPAAKYTVTITDDEKCMVDKQFEVTRSVPPQLMQKDIKTTDVSCFDATDGEIMIADTRYNLKWEGIPQAPNPNQIKNLSPGTYELILSNKTGEACDTMYKFPVNKPQAPLKIDEIKIIQRSPCTGVMGGKLQSVVSGGWPPYTFTWTKNGTNAGTTETITSSDGTYALTVTDSKNCKVTASKVVDLAALSQFYNLISERPTYNPLPNNLISLSPNTWDDPKLTFPFGANSQFTFFNKNTVINNFWLLDEFSGLVLSNKDIKKDNLNNEVASLIIVYGSDLVDKGYKLWSNNKSEASKSPIKFETIGAVGQRTWSIEWGNAGFFNELSETNQTNSTVNVKIRFVERDKTIEIHFGDNSIQNPALAHNGKNGPLIAFVKDYNFKTDTFSNIWYLTGNPANPGFVNEQNKSLQKFTETIVPLNSHPLSGQMYKFCRVNPNEFAPEPSPEIEIYVSPNPTYERTTVRFSPLLQRTQVWVSDQLGRQVLPSTELAPGATETALNLQGLPKGLYLIHLKDGQHKQVQKVIKQ